MATSCPGALNLEHFRHVLAGFTVLLDGESRLRQVKPCPLGSFYEPPKDYLTALHRNPEKLEELRKRVYDTFGFHLAIDILDMNQARFVAASEPPNDPLLRSTGVLSGLFHRAVDPALRDLLGG